jgi:hypothetical protein
MHDDHHVTDAFGHHQIDEAAPFEQPNEAGMTAKVAP